MRSFLQGNYHLTDFFFPLHSNSSLIVQHASAQPLSLSFQTAFYICLTADSETYTNLCKQVQATKS